MPARCACQGATGWRRRYHRGREHEPRSRPAAAHPGHRPGALRGRRRRTSPVSRTVATWPRSRPPAASPWPSTRRRLTTSEGWRSRAWTACCCRVARILIRRSTASRAHGLCRHRARPRCPRAGRLAGRRASAAGRCWASVAGSRPSTSSPAAASSSISTATPAHRTDQAPPTAPDACRPRLAHGPHPAPDRPRRLRPPGQHLPPPGLRPRPAGARPGRRRHRDATPPARSWRPSSRPAPASSSWASSATPSAPSRRRPEFARLFAFFVDAARGAGSGRA